MQEEPTGERKNIPTAVYFLLPLLIMGFVLVGVGLYQERRTDVSALPATAIAGPTQATTTSSAVDVPGDGLGVVSGPATPWAVAGGLGEPAAAPTSIAAVTAPPAVVLPLLGPPTGSMFQAGDVVTFYWSSPEPAGHGRRFVVYLSDGDARLVLGTVDEENLGRAYQLQAAPGRAVGEASSYSWAVVLEDGQTGAIIGQSEIRTITILEDN